MRKHVLGTITVAAAFAGVVVGAPPASAEPNPPGCEKGYFCAYSGTGQTGNLVLKTASNWSGRVEFRSAFNNGFTYPGADHVDVTLEGIGNPGTYCFHYSPGPGPYHMTADFPGAFITRVVWRGEC